MQEKSLTPFLPQQLIIKKRNGLALDAGEWGAFLASYLAGELLDYQMSAMLMAVYFQGMSWDETVSWVNLLKSSGTVLDWGVDKSKVIDKHSTGGVGDKTSLVVLPLAVTQGVLVPMIAGRGLGHTGGTVDKVEAVGWQTQIEPNEFQSIVRRCGGSLVGQTPSLAPLDRKLYALRDVTGTVESIPLIVASILSKKLAEGIGGLVMDVKYGSGAFMPNMDQVLSLAQQLHKVGENAGIKVKGVISSMDSPLGHYSGNSLEMFETVEILQGRGPKDSLELSLELASQMVQLAYPSRKKESIVLALQKAISSGLAWDTFLKIAKAHHADISLLENPSRLVQAPAVHTVTWPKDRGPGYIKSIDVKALGFALVQLGGGRSKVTDVVHHAVGFFHSKKVGDHISPKEELLKIYGKSVDECRRIEEALTKIFVIQEAKVEAQPLVFSHLGTSVSLD